MLRINVAPAEGASANHSARIIIMIWWTNIAWLSQIRAASRRKAWAKFPAITTFRPIATQSSNPAETRSRSEAQTPRAALLAAPKTSGRSGLDRSPFI